MANDKSTVVHSTTISEFNPSEDKWGIWKERLDIHFTEINCTEEKAKKAILLKSIGSSAYELLRSLCDPKTPVNIDLSELCDILESHFTPPTIVYHERKNFHDAIRNENESVSTWYARIKKLALQCKYGNNLDVMVKDKFITQLPEKIFTRICEEDENLSLADALKKAMKVNTDSEVNYMSSKKGQKPRNKCNNNRKTAVQPPGKKTACTRCGWKTHEATTCQYKEATCHTCSKKGHLSSVCRSKQENNKKNFNFINSSNSNPYVNSISNGNSFDFSLYSLNDDESSGMYCLKVKFSGTMMDIACDTGAPRTFVPKTFYEKHLSQYPLMASSITYGDTSKRITVVVTDANAPPLLGRNFLRAFKFLLVQMDQNHENLVHSIRSPENRSLSVIVDQIKSQFSELFDGQLGKYNVCEISLQIDSQAKPVFCKPRPIPIAWKSEIEQNLRDLVANGVLEQIETAKWGTPLVPVPKPDGKLRVCGDYKTTINKFLVDVKYPLPLIEEIFTSLQGGELFSKLDMSAAYNQLCLDEASSLLCAWSTHIGTFKMKRLPFGVKPAAAIFQMHMENLLRGINGVVVYQDDITVTGRDFKDHLFNLKSVLKKMADAGLRLNAVKCIFFQKQISYLGFTIDKNGLHKNRDRFASILDAPIPKDIHELRAFIGMANYYSRFIKDFSNKMNPLYILLRKDVQFIWNTDCEKAYDLIKHDISSEQVMTHFNPKLPIVLTTDACKHSVAGVLSHRFPDGLKPVAFISRSLSKSELNYSVIEKEALAIFFSVTKLKQYLLGNFFTISTDHKPLLSIFGETHGLPLMAAARMQRWALILSGFNYEIKYVKGIDNEADSLSRLPQLSYIEKYNDANYIDLIEKDNAFRINFKNIAIETRRDPILIKLLEAIESTTIDKLDSNFDVFKSKSLELTVQYGCIMWGFRTVVPTKLRQYILNELHASHMGVVKTKSLARSYVWWPKIDSEIENLIKKCVPCQQLQASPPKAELIPWIPTDSVWSRIHIDFAGPNLNHYFLIVVDSHTKWAEVFKTKIITSAFTIGKLRELFSRYGIPDKIVSDNGTQFKSAEFNDFTTRNNIEHIFTSPGHAATNGQAENFVKTFKKSFIASVNSAKSMNSSHNIDKIINRILLDYRNTIHCTTNETPAKLFFGRTLRTRFSNLRPPTVSEVVESKQNKQIKYFKGKRNVTFNKGQKVMIRNHKDPNNASWLPAKIKQKMGPRTYTCVYTHNNKEINRHLDQIRDQSIDTDKPLYEDVKANATVISVSDEGSGNELQSSPSSSNDSKANDPDWIPNATRSTSDSGHHEKQRKLRSYRNRKVS
ncbi:uncharacterized protein K02A2.6-like [Eupeodes corollae]|uniref:uncharacterized protein K02A2.6-like n=1 Tax=Eupeodes corollae TaxID=290404 RepID=UPI0024909829|nr:uncharacterized protein K02A2.6-like [Eupeodes corollae]